MCDLLKNTKREIVGKKKYVYFEEDAGPGLARVKTYFEGNDALEACQSRDYNLAFTAIVFRQDKADADNPPQWNTVITQPQRIVLCRWVMDHWKHVNYKTWSGFYGSAWRYKGSKLVIPIMQAIRWPVTQIGMSQPSAKAESQVRC
jgi:hypothetical protein